MRLVRISALAGLLFAAANANAADHITLNFTGEMSAVERQSCIDAAGFWNSVITGYKANIDVDGNPYTHGLVITAEMGDFDDEYGVLGYSNWNEAVYVGDSPMGAPGHIRYNYASKATMTLDRADVPMHIAGKTFYAVVLREMAHAIGVGTIWDINTIDNTETGALLYDPSGPSVDDPRPSGESVGRYLGQNAITAWQTEFNMTGVEFVPVEKSTDPNAANAYWNETDYGSTYDGPSSAITGLDFSQELMTAWVDDTFIFLSTLTLGALEDIGFEVDYSKAGVIEHTPVPEPGVYGLFGAVSLAAAAARRRRGDG